MEPKKKILLIEDDTDTSDLYKETLTEAGYEVETAPDGMEGLTKALKGGYNLILLDVMMPKMDGITFLMNMKDKQLPAPNGSIVLLTNLTHDEAIKEAMNLGAKGYLVKSDLNPDELLEKLKSFV